MEIKAGMLAFEVTRRCNESCLHCCKGKAESIDMTKEIIDKVLKNPNHKIKEMKYLSIAGGEPTLVPNIVSYLIDPSSKKMYLSLVILILLLMVLSIAMK